MNDPLDLRCQQNEAWKILNWLTAVILTEPIKVTQETISYYVAKLWLFHGFFVNMTKFMVGISDTKLTESKPLFMDTIQ